MFWCAAEEMPMRAMSLNGGGGRERSVRSGANINRQDPLDEFYSFPLDAGQAV